MNKFRKLTWFGAFCSLFQYTRDRKMLAYVVANIFGCVVPALLAVLFLQQKIGGMAFVWINVAARLAFAPVDEYSSGEYAYVNLASFPLNIFEMFWIRLVAKLTQVSEWAFMVSLGYVYSVLFGFTAGISLAVLTSVALQIAEELLFYLVWLIRKRGILVAAYLTVCAGIIVAALLCPEISAIWTAVIWCTVLVLSVVGTLVAHANRQKIRPLYGRVAKGKKVRIPLSSRLMRAASGKGPLFRLVCMEWICMLKLKLLDVVSALGYVVVFAALDKSHSLLYVLIQYFIVDYCFLAGFNYFATINDSEGMFLFSTVDRKIQLRSKNLALASLLLVLSSVLTIVLGLLTGVGLKTLVLTGLTNLFCISVMVLCSSVVSITHFHLNESKKKYTASNMIIMVVTLAVSSVLSAFVLAGGMLGAITLIFMGVTTLACAYFSLLDVSMLVSLFDSREQSMIASLRG